MTQLTAACALADGLARQHLRDDAPATDVMQTARDLLGMHASGGRIRTYSYSSVCQGLRGRRWTRSVRTAQSRARPLHARHLIAAAARPPTYCLGGHSRADAVSQLLNDPGPNVSFLRAWASLVDTVLAGRALSAAQIRTELGAGRDVPIPAVPH